MRARVYSYLRLFASLVRELQERLALPRVGAGHEAHGRQRRRRRLHAERAAAGAQEALCRGRAQSDRLRRVRRI